MSAIPERAEPTLWKAEQSENARQKANSLTCEKEKRSLNIRHIGETVIRHFKSKA
jgi:hypothetical protein